MRCAPASDPLVKIFFGILFALVLILPGGPSVYAQATNPNELHFYFKQRVGGNVIKDEASMLFQDLPGVSRGRDTYDGSNLGVANQDIASVPLPGLMLALNVMPDLTRREVIPLFVDGAQGAAWLMIRDFNSFPVGTKFYLRDSVTHTTTQIGVTGTGSVADSTVYNFNVTASPASEGMRFTLIFEPGSGPGPCPAAPAATAAEVVRCGPGPVTAALATSQSGCTAEWFLASRGTAGSPLGTGQTFTTNVTVSDTLLVRFNCGATCNTAFTKIAVTVEQSPFNITLNPTSASPGNIVRITGSLLNLVDRVTLSGIDMPFARVSNSELTFQLTQGPPSGLVRVFDDGGQACPDSAPLTVLPAPCDPPTIQPAVTSYCGTSQVFFEVDSVTPGCTIRWYRSTLGTTGPPLATTPTLSTLIGRSDTILVQQVCGATCISAFAKLPITINQTPFRIRLAPDSGRIGDLVRIRGLQLRNVTSVLFGGVPVAFQGATDTLLTFRVPPNAQTNYVSVQGGSVCPDSALFRVTRPCNAPISYTMTSLAPCGPQRVVVTVDSVAGTGCQMQWYLASEPNTVISTDSMITQPFSTTDTILVRRYCNPGCISAFTSIPVPVQNTPFNITLDPDAGRPGDTITVRGTQLDKVTRMTLRGDTVQIRTQTDTSLTFIVPLMTQGTAQLVVADTLQTVCPDSVMFTVTFPMPDTCLIRPEVNVTGFTMCQPRPIRMAASAPGNCPIEWYLKSGGTNGPPVATGERFDLNVRGTDTVMVRRMCAANCSSEFIEIPVVVTESPFRIELRPDSGRPGDTLTAVGFMLDSLRYLSISGTPVSITMANFDSIQFIVPDGLSVGWHTLLGSTYTPSRLCNDSTDVRILGPLAVRHGKHTATFKVQPNPARDAFTVTLAQPSPGPVLLELVDLSGRVVTSRKAEEANSSIPMRLKGISPGLYQLRVHAQGQVQIGKVVVE